MSFCFTADYGFRRLTDISPAFLRERGLKLLLLDIDNTIAPYKTPEPGPEVLAWAGELKKSGVTLFIVSNSKKTGRVERFSRALDAGFIGRAGKPRRAGILKAAEICGIPPGNAALAGDQTFTDIFGARLAGVAAILIRPIRFENPFHALRYIAELPFRAFCKEKVTK